MNIGVKHRRESKDVSQQLAQLGIKAQRGIQAVGTLLHEASQELVPVDTNTLKLSSRVRTEGTGFETVVFVGYGIKGDIFVGYSEQERRIVTRVPAEYAVLVHQINKPHAGKTQFNFLEQPRTDKFTEMQLTFREAFTTAEV